MLLSALYKKKVVGQVLKHVFHKKIKFLIENIIVSDLKNHGKIKYQEAVMALFSPESKLYKGISFVGNMLLLNLFWVLFSLPIITVGASTLALYSTFFKIMEGTEGYLFKDFWKGFKSNWKQGTILWLITLAAGYGFYLDFQILKTDPGIPVIVASIVAFVFICFSLLYAYPLSARYENKFYMHIKNSFLLSTRYLGKTFFLILILAFEIGLFIWNQHTLIFLVVIGPAVLVYTIAGTAKKVFLTNDEKVKNDAAMEKAKEEGREYMENLSRKILEQKAEEKSERLSDDGN